MNTRRFRLVPVLTAALLCLVPNLALAQPPAGDPPVVEEPGEKKAPWKPGLKLASALVPVLKAGISLGEKGFGFNEKLCILGGAVQKGKFASFAFKMEAGKAYAFVGAGGEGTKNINVAVLDAQKKVLFQDDSTEPAAGIVFECKETGTYSIRVELAEAEADTYCSLGILVKDGGVKLTPDDILTALNASLNAWTQIDEAMKGQGAFNDGVNQWTLYGTVLAQDKSLEITNIRPGAGAFVVVATGSGPIEDINLTIKDATGKNVVAKDDKVSPAALVVIKSEGKDSFRLNIRNAKSKAPSLIFATVMRSAQ